MYYSLSDSRKHPYLYHWLLFGILKGGGVVFLTGILMARGLIIPGISKAWGFRFKYQQTSDNYRKQNTGHQSISQSCVLIHLKKKIVKTWAVLQALETLLKSTVFIKTLVWSQCNFIQEVTILRVGTFWWLLVHGLPRWTWSMVYLNGLPMDYLKWTTRKFVANIHREEGLF